MHRAPLIILRGCGLMVLGAPLLAPAQQAAPVEERSPANVAPLLQLQQRTSAAYRDVQQSAFEAKLAEQDVLNTQDAYTGALKRAEMLKEELDRTVKARDAAKAREAAARKRYDAALQTDVR